MLHGYRLNDPTLPPSSLTRQEFDELKASLMFGVADEDALRRAHLVIADKTNAILDVWYAFVGSTPHLLAYFSNPETGTPIPEYLAAVRARFAQWILDTCRAEYDGAWLAYQDEIGRRHHWTGKNAADDFDSAPHIPLRRLLALTLPISVTMRSFLAQSGLSEKDVEEMHLAWTKAVLLQVILWSRPYTRANEF